ncbi:MAG: M48 family metalloprotease, partial [Candidatus Omnitrophica bacterium]|nr:M48 family metalloprotease [Candidatus Omnitrophota bacterium]
MPFSFIEIEQKKSRLILFVFLFLIFFYFLTVWLLLLIVRNFFFASAFGNEFIFTFPPLSHTLIALAVAFLIGLLHWSVSTSNLIDKISASIDASPVDPKDNYHQYLKNIVDEVSIAIGGRHIEPYVIPTSALNAYSLVDFQDNAVIGVTEGLLARLNRSQIEAVVGHEAGHIVSGDSFNATVICSLSEIYKETVSRLGQGTREFRLRGKGGVLILLIFIVLTIMNFLNQLLNTFISRQREYRADAVSVRLTRNPLALAEALRLISQKWHGSGINGENIESIFIVSPNVRSIEEQEGLAADLFATHPPIDKRVNILLDMAHLDEKTLDENIKNMIRVSPIAKAEFKEGVSSDKKRWFVFKQD